MEQKSLVFFFQTDYSPSVTPQRKQPRFFLSLVKMAFCNKLGQISPMNVVLRDHAYALQPKNEKEAVVTHRQSHRINHAC